jgi:ubiquinone/menaquinone biosynthesis C-methylase UbiE
MEEPTGYVEAQYQVNNRHSDGSIEASYEEAIVHAARLAKWIKEARLPCDSILDAGCRTGYAMEALASHFPAAEVHGIDIVPEFVATANLRGEAIVGDLQALPYDDQQFDWTFSCTAIEHCYDLKAAATEMQRVSRIGYYVLTDLEDEQRFDQNPSHFTHHNDPAEWVDEFRHPAWWLMHLDVPRYSRIEMIWVRREHVTSFRKENDKWA